MFTGEMATPKRQKRLTQGMAMTFRDHPHGKVDISSGGGVFGVDERFTHNGTQTPVAIAGFAFSLAKSTTTTTHFNAKIGVSCCHWSQNCMRKMLQALFLGLILAVHGMTFLTLGALELGRHSSRVVVFAPFVVRHTRSTASAPSQSTFNDDECCIDRSTTKSFADTII